MGSQERKDQEVFVAMGIMTKSGLVRKPQKQAQRQKPTHQEDKSFGLLAVLAKICAPRGARGKGTSGRSWLEHSRNGGVEYATCGVIIFPHGVDSKDPWSQLFSPLGVGGVNFRDVLNL